MYNLQALKAWKAVWRKAGPIYRYRKKQELTLAAAGLLFDATTTTVWLWEHGVQSPSRPAFDRMSAVMDIEPEALANAWGRWLVKLDDHEKQLKGLVQTDQTRWDRFWERWEQQGPKRGRPRKKKHHLGDGEIDTDD